MRTSAKRVILASAAAVAVVPPTIALCFLILRAVRIREFDSDTLIDLLGASLGMSIFAGVIVAIVAPVVGLIAIDHIRKTKRWLGAATAAAIGGVLGALPFLILTTAPNLLAGGTWSSDVLVGAFAMPFFGTLTGLVAGLTWWCVAVRKNPELQPYRAV